MELNQVNVRGCSMKNGYELWQSEWRGISLISIAEKYGLDLNSIATSDIYAEYYKQQKNKNFSFGDYEIEYEESHFNAAMWLEKVCDQYCDMYNKRKDDLTILSVGCGLGNIEAILIEHGFHLELQECQEESFEYLKMKNCLPENYYATTDFSTLPTNKYDVIYVGCVVYAMNEEQYELFLKNCYRMLKTTGLLLITEQSINLKQKVISMLRPIKRRIFGGEKRLLWGFFRTSKRHTRIAKSQRLVLKKEVILRTCENKGFEETQYPTRLFCYDLKDCESARCLYFEKIDSL